MKAKMPLKQPETGIYFCLNCNTSFAYSSNPLRCPKCSETTNLATIYLQDNPLEEQFYTKIDWHGG